MPFIGCLVKSVPAEGALATDFFFFVIIQVNGKVFQASEQEISFVIRYGN